MIWELYTTIFGNIIVFLAAPSAASNGSLPMTAAPEPRFPADWLTGLDMHLAGYRDFFARADQARSFGLYVRGLLSGPHRKNVESIAGGLRGRDSRWADLAQSLQHFISQSPWDAGRVMSRYRELARPTAAGRTWVVHDGIVPKKGRNSVGVHRQFARSLGRKVNCQVAVVVTEVDGGSVPLTARLYLPSSWLRTCDEQAARTIPEPFRRSLSKPEVALQLLDELLSVSRPGQLVAEDGYTSIPGFCEGIERRGISLVAAGDSAEVSIRSARDGFDRLKDEFGLSHFEGRTWTGWHHHLALVLVAYGFVLRNERAGATRVQTLPSSPAN